MDQNLALMRTAWAGGALPGGDKLYPSSPTLVDRIWQATFTVAGARRAGLAGDGLMLSRTQPRSPDAPKASLADIQNPMIDAYLEALPKGREPRILASRTVFVGRRFQGGDAPGRNRAGQDAPPARRDRQPVVGQSRRRSDRRRSTSISARPKK